jgi:hypothetical protein
MFFVEKMMNNEIDFIPTPHSGVLIARLQQEDKIYSTKLTLYISMQCLLLHPFEDRLGTRQSRLFGTNQTIIA